MKLKYKVLEQCEDARAASLAMGALGTEAKNFVLFELAEDLLANEKKIVDANRKDMRLAQGKISESLLQRLQVDQKKVLEMADMVRSVAKLEDPVGKILSETEMDDSLILRKISVPIGVLCCIFESRPDAIVQISALAIKSGNAVLLKGGKEAERTNRILVEIIRNSIKDNKGMPEDAVQLVETREAVKEILKMGEFIDLIVPRGSSALVKFIQSNTKIPVLGHAEGVCAVYIDREADLGKALRVTFDAKCQYPAVCNAMENLLIHEHVAGRFVPLIAREFLRNNVEVRGDEAVIDIIRKDKAIQDFIASGKIKKEKIKKASEKDWGMEYNDLIISVKIVHDVDEAIDFINKHGSGHTDAIVTENKEHAGKFATLVDSSSVMVNASTRFADGYRYGLGAEVGISTNKIHARGPVGLEGLVIHKYILEGKGHTVKEYVEGKKKFVHRKLV
ncbi:glutamate-5-semialdehyde dehydrogenase [Candidatus Woesearchaeota archaeon]|nr:glutamate-5-semialdehyde dehydrogenase [Candidatus Woesearchaeota archaeon]